MYNLLYEDHDFKLYKKDNDDETMLVLKFTGETSIEINEFKKLIKNEKRCKKLHENIDEYRLIMKDKNDSKTEYYYIACASPDEYLVLDPLDLVLAITINDDKITLKSMDDESLLKNNKYERITKFNMVIDKNDKKIKCKISYKTQHKLLKNIKYKAVFDFLVKIFKIEEI